MITILEAPPIRFCTLDTGPRNLLDREAIDALSDALAFSEETPVVLLRGRADAFCAGLDARILGGPRAEAEALLAAMGRLLHEVFASPTRVVSVCEGHAVAAGGMLLLVSDWRIAAPGDYQVGFSEPRIGLPLPELPALLARERLDRRRLHELTVLGQTLPPEQAQLAGFLDELVPHDDLEARARARASELAELSAAAYTGTHRAVHGRLLDRIDRLAREQAERAACAAERWHDPIE